MTLKEIEMVDILVRIISLRYPVKIDEKFDYNIPISLECYWLMFPI